MQQNPQNLLYQIALTQIKGVGDITASNLLKMVGGSVEAIFRSGKKELMSFQGISDKLAGEILNPEVLRKAEKEVEFVLKNKIRTFFITEEAYPARMKECIDAPVMLYLKGNVEINTQKVIGVVGTRKCTNYGSGFCKDLMKEITASFPNALIVSGLAYGIDINAHRAALENSLPTIGVLAHGLDRLYPSAHRKTAVEMLDNGGLLTEFPSGTEPDKYNFVRRNRIIAGISDAVVIVESDLKGGSLITAEIANTYNKEVFAVPGRISDTYSKGCNKLIENNKAILYESFSGFLKQMNWEDGSASLPRQQTLFGSNNLSGNEGIIYNKLVELGATHVNRLAIETEIPLSQLFLDLFGLEMKKIIRALPGGSYETII